MNLNDRQHDRTHDSAPDEMDNLLAVHLSAGEELTPSSGFALSVMEAIQTEASAPPPIPFPWRRVVPGLIAVLCAMVGFGVFALHELRTGSATVSGSQSVLQGLASGQQMRIHLIHLTTLEQALGWIAMATCVSIAAVAGSMRLAAPSSKMRV